MPNSSGSDLVQIILRDWEDLEKIVDIQKISRNVLTEHSFFFRNFATIVEGEVDFPHASHFKCYLGYLDDSPKDLTHFLQVNLASRLHESISIHFGIWHEGASLAELALSLDYLSGHWTLGYLLGDAGFCNAAMESLLDLPIEEHPDVVPIMVQHCFDVDAHRGTPLQRWTIDWVSIKATAVENDRLQGDWAEGFVRDLLKRVVRLGEPGEISYMGPQLEGRANYRYFVTEESYGESFSALLRKIRDSAAESD